MHKETADGRLRAKQSCPADSPAAISNVLFGNGRNILKTLLIFHSTFESST